jgi:hypothetical protein
VNRPLGSRVTVTPVAVVPGAARLNVEAAGMAPAVCSSASSTVPGLDGLSTASVPVTAVASTGIPKEPASWKVSGSSETSATAPPAAVLESKTRAGSTGW